MKRLRILLIAGMLAAGGLVAAFSPGCSSQTMVCCDNSSLRLCVCYENNTCDSDEENVSVCPSYRYCCRNSGDFCSCWNDTCLSEETQVSVCPSQP
jgi:hypothetical protein